MSANGPPPINYATHPRRLQQAARSAASPPIAPNAATLPENGSQPTAMRPASIYSTPSSTHLFIYEELPVVSTAPSFVRARSAVSPGSIYPSPSSSHLFYDELPAVSTAPSLRQARSQADASGTESTLDGLGDVFANISIGTTPASALPAPQASQAPPSIGSPATSTLPVPFAHLSLPSTPRRRTKKKFYSVTVGKCCGVFDNWQVYCHSALYICVHPLAEIRNYAKSLIDGVSGGSAVGFSSYEAAVDNYYDMKARNLVRVEREPGDNLNFGPLSEAIM